MPECSHCEAFVSAEYVRVMGVDGEVAACPHCPDRIPSAGHEGGWLPAAERGKTGVEREEAPLL